MPKNNKPAPSPVDELIASAKAKAVSPLVMPDAQTLAELERILAYNDTATNKGRVTAEAAIVFLQSRGWKGNCKQALVRVCVSALGRKSWGSP